MATDSRKLIHELRPTPSREETSATSINIRRGWQNLTSPNSLSIEFKRTIRVSDNNNTNDLPPSLGSFPLYQTSDYLETLPLPMAAKGGYFLPMHRMSCPHSCTNYVLTAL